MNRETFLKSVDACIEGIRPLEDNLRYGEFPLTDEYPIVSPQRYKELIEHSTARLLESGVADTKEDALNILGEIYEKAKARFGADDDKQESLCLRIIPVTVMAILTDESALEKESKKGFGGIPPYEWNTTELEPGDEEAILGYGM